MNNIKICPIPTRFIASTLAAICGLGMGVEMVTPKEPVQAQTVPPVSQRFPSVKGTVTYRQRIALPPNAVVRVRLLDTARQDAAAVAIGEKLITNPGQVPIPFEISYNSGDINPSHTYTLEALIFVDNQIRFKHTQAYPVITQGKPNTVEVVVQPVGSTQ